ncbi:MAG: hypothetical protein EBR82_47050 [Caulobacteraceae bacterium]|nr:hypothetical protein [Caulobacteraceae bacterium]
MTHDPRAREVIALARVWTPHIFCGLEDNEGRDLPDLQYDNLPPDWQQRMREMASDGLHALHRAGLRVVSAEPSEADVERVARAIDDTYNLLIGGDISNLNQVARAAIRAFLGGGDE